MAAILNVISWLVFGLVVGAIARFLMPGRQSMSWLATSLLGIAGSLVGGILSWLVFGTPEATINAAGWIMSILGAIVAMVVYGKMKGAPGKTSSF
jgi:uncharacterized membrane protein YeaQ/YmgE (transglycosylase-associated protein family)